MTDVPWRLTRSLSSKKEREATSLTVAEGPPSVTSALESGARIEFMIVSESFARSPDYGLLHGKRAQDGRDPREYVVSDALFEKMSEVRTPQGVLAVLRFPFQYFAGPPRPRWGKPLYLYCIDIQDPGNAGTLIRAAGAAGVDAAVFCGQSVDVFSPKCIRASAGAVFKVRLEEVSKEAPVAVLEGLEAQGVTVLKAAPRGGAPPWEVCFSESCAIVVGNEARGLPEDILEGPGRLVSVPMPGDTESLNVAMASGILLYEAVRQRLLSGTRSR